MKFSLVMLNWERPRNVAAIVADLIGHPYFGDALIFNNNPRGGLALNFPRGAPVTVVNASRDLGLYTRFAAGCLARERCVLMQDDDLELPRATVSRLVEAWHADPAIVHGIFGRKPKPDGSYAADVLGDAQVPIVLTRALVVDRFYCSDFFAHAHRFDQIQREGKPLGNGEDILLSYVARFNSGRLNRIHPLQVKEIASNGGIHKRNWSAHIRHRSRLLRALEAWPKDPPRGEPGASPLGEPGV